MTALEQVQRLIVFFTEKLATLTQQLADATAAAAGSAEAIAAAKAIAAQAVIDRDAAIANNSTLQAAVDADMTEDTAIAAAVSAVVDAPPPVV